MSIGIMVDSLKRKQIEATNKSQVPGPNAEMKNSVKDNYAVAKLHDRSVGDLNKGKQAEAPQNASSPWISPRSLCRETLNKETKLSSHLPSTKGRNSKLNGKKGANIENTVHFFSNQVTTSGNSKEKSKGSGAKGKTGDDGNTTAREDDFTFATAHDGLASIKVVTGDKTEEKTETLRVKLWEILGIVAVELPKFVHLIHDYYVNAGSCSCYNKDQKSEDAVVKLLQLHSQPTDRIKSSFDDKKILVSYDVSS